MFSRKIPERLAELEDTRVIEVRDEALAYLRVNDFDYCGCADVLGIPLSVLFSIRERYRTEFVELHLRFLSKCERTVVQAALGHLDLESKATAEQIKHAKWVLERQAPSWNKTNKLEVKDTTRGSIIDISPKVAKLLEEHERATGSLRASSSYGGILQADDGPGSGEADKGDGSSGGDILLPANSIPQTGSSNRLV